jgi:hypothetical protein
MRVCPSFDFKRCAIYFDGAPAMFHAVARSKRFFFRPPFIAAIFSFSYAQRCRRRAAPV